MGYRRRPILHHHGRPAFQSCISSGRDVQRKQDYLCVRGSWAWVCMNNMALKSHLNSKNDYFKLQISPQCVCWSCSVKKPPNPDHKLQQQEQVRGASMWREKFPVRACCCSASPAGPAVFPGALEKMAHYTGKHRTRTGISGTLVFWE